MAVTFSIRILNLDKAKKSLGELPELLRKNVASSLQKSAYQLLAAASRKTPVDTGRLRASLNVHKSRDGLTVSVGTPLKYGVYVHQGTRPHFPPVNALRGWANRHNINPYLVSRAIARRGTKARRFLKDPLDQMRHKIKSNINKAVEQSLQQTANKI